MIQKSFVRAAFAVVLFFSAGTTPNLVQADVLYDLVPMPGDFDLIDFDHRGTLGRDGITATFTAQSDEGLFAILGKLVFTPTNFGISIDDATDQDPSLIDAGNSDTFGFVPERMLISFDRAIRLDEMTLRYLPDGSTARLLNPDDTLDVYAELVGTSDEFDMFDLTSNPIVLAPGQQIGLSYVNGSFALKSFRVSAVPEPGAGCILVMTALAISLRRRKF